MRYYLKDLKLKLKILPYVYYYWFIIFLIFLTGILLMLTKSYSDRSFGVLILGVAGVFIFFLMHGESVFVSMMYSKRLPCCGSLESEIFTCKTCGKYICNKCKGNFKVNGVAPLLCHNCLIDEIKYGS